MAQMGEWKSRSQNGQTPLIALTIAGFDPSGGAGVTADLQTFAAHGLYGVSAITCLTVQSTLEVAGIQAIKGDLLGKTLSHLAADLQPDGVKIGMLGTVETVKFVTEFLRSVHGAVKVLDPVIRSSSGFELLEPEGVDLLKLELLPRVGWVTPNWEELGALTGREVWNLGEARSAAVELGSRYPELHVVATGGDAKEPVDLLWMPGGMVEEFRGERVETTSTHGTGCAFSSALLARLMLGDGPSEAVAGAKTYVAEAMRRAPGVGHGRGPLDLLWPLRG
jgi:hydroxymethylpyrimidine/phosphomethylpyrimidine kinase